MSDRPFISHFSPQRTDPELLERIHVQEERRHLLEESVSAMRESVLTANKHHLLFIGPRGAGKTHLVRLIHHRLSLQADLTEKFRFAWLNEDETATSFLKLLILIYRDVSQRYPQDFPAADLQSIYGQPADIARERLGESLLRHLGDRTLVVLMENLDSLFKHMPEGEQRIWRAFVQNHPVFATVGTAQSLFDGVADRSQPFFGFFDTRHLTPLNVEDAVQLLTNIARVNGDEGDEELAAFLQTPTGHARVQAIHDLAGGNPRIYLIFSEFLTKRSLESLVDHLERVTDRELTSYYQERLRWLSPQQQEIVQLLSLHSHSLRVKEIAENLFSSHNSITGQLKALRTFGYVRFKPHGREVVYELAEPLMRLAVQIKCTNNRQPLKLIVEMLRVWYNREDLETRRNSHPFGSLERSYFDAAITNEDRPSRSGRNSGGSGGKIEEWIKNDDELYEAGKYQESLELLNRIIGAGEIEAEPLSRLFYARAHTHEKLSNIDHAISDYSQCIDRFEADPKVKASAIFNRAVLYAQIGNIDAAISDYSKIISDYSDERELLGKSLYNRAATYAALNQNTLSIHDYTKLIDDSLVGPQLMVMALVNRSVRHMLAGKNEAAMTDLSRAIDLPSAPNDELAQAHINRSLLLARAKKWSEAIEDCNWVINNNHCSPAKRSMALINRGFCRAALGEDAAASSDYESVVSMEEAPISTRAMAQNNRALEHSAKGRHTEALRDIEAVMELVQEMRGWSLVRGSVDALMSALLKSMIVQAESAFWSKTANRFMCLSASTESLNELGKAIVASLYQVSQSMLNDSAFNSWVEVWTSAVAKLKPEDQAKMEIPLRLLRTGITYLKTKDEGSLLILPIEERKILRDALKLPPESAE